MIDFVSNPSPLGRAEWDFSQSLTGFRGRYTELLSCTDFPGFLYRLLPTNSERGLVLCNDITKKTGKTVHSMAAGNDEDHSRSGLERVKATAGWCIP